MRALVAEDNPVFRSMLRTMLLRWEYDVTVVDDGLAAWDVLQSPDAPQLAILDWMMPGLDGVDVCRRVRASARESYVYVLLLTARTDQKDLIEGMEAGADDYVTKPFSAQELRVRLRAGRRILELQEELVLAREALREQATRDPLTGLWNRGAVLDILQKEVARGVRERGSLAVLMLDIDHFKQINDTLGHMAGDRVLREVGNRLNATVRKYDAVGRYGGEEFLAVLPGCDESTALKQAERLRLAMCERPIAAMGHELKVSCSIGAACSSGGIALLPDSLLRSADEALYTAKRAGRNRCELADAAALELQSIAGEGD